MARRWERLVRKTVYRKLLRLMMLPSLSRWPRITQLLLLACSSCCSLYDIFRPCKAFICNIFDFLGVMFRYQKLIKETACMANYFSWMWTPIKLHTVQFEEVNLCFIISVGKTYMDKAWIFLVYFLKLLICFHTYDFLRISTHTNQVGNTLEETIHHVHRTSM